MRCRQKTKKVASGGYTQAGRYEFIALQEYSPFLLLLTAQKMCGHAEGISLSLKVVLQTVQYTREIIAIARFVENASAGWPTDEDQTQA